MKNKKIIGFLVCLTFIAAAYAEDNSGCVRENTEPQKTLHRIAPDEMTGIPGISYYEFDYECDCSVCRHDRGEGVREQNELKRQLEILKEEVFGH